MRTVLIFGVFDGFHQGHRVFIEQASKRGEKLIAVVARDGAVLALKGKKPHHGEAKRLETVKMLREVSFATLGDDEQGSYEVVKTYQPDTICLGYDQEALAKDLAQRMAEGQLPVLPIIRLDPHEPHLFHTSLIRAEHGF